MKLVLFLLLVGACSDPAIDMNLVAAKTTSAVDLSCVTAVDVLPIAVDDAATLDIGNREGFSAVKVPCVNVKNIKTIADVQAQLAQLDIPMPTGGIAGIELRGREGTCDEVPAYRDSIFYGAAVVDAHNDSLDIPVRYNVTCGQTTKYTVKTIDLPTLIKTKTCTPLTTGELFEGTVRPSLLPTIASPIMFEDGYDIEGLDATGATQLTMYSSSFAGSCPSAAYESDVTDAPTTVASTCVNAGAPTACAGAGEIELPTVSFDYASKLFAPGSPPNGTGVIGAVWTNTGTKGPVMGATVTPDESSNAIVVYGDVGTTAFTTSSDLTATNASGMFAVYSNTVTGITVTAPGHAPQHVWVGAGPYWPGTALVVLP